MKNQNKAWVLLAMIAMFILLSGCSDRNLREVDTSVLSSPQSGTTLEIELLAYSYAVSTFHEVTAEEVEDAISNGEEFFLYVGRATCEWCRKIAPVLSQVAQEDGIEIYYLDSTNTESDLSIKTFRETYGIETVPTIMEFFSNGEYDILEYNLMESRSNLVKTLSKLVQ